MTPLIARTFAATGPECATSFWIKKYARTGARPEEVDVALRPPSCGPVFLKHAGSSSSTWFPPPRSSGRLTPFGRSSPSSLTTGARSQGATGIVTVPARSASSEAVERHGGGGAGEPAGEDHAVVR